MNWIEFGISDSYNEIRFLCMQLYLDQSFSNLPASDTMSIFQLLDSIITVVKLLCVSIFIFSKLSKLELTLADNHGQDDAEIYGQLDFCVE